MPVPEPDKFDLDFIQRPFVLYSPRSLWPKEVQDLTPWVLGNLDELGRELGMMLEPTGTEVAVGTFRTDITAKDGLALSRALGWTSDTPVVPTSGRSVSTGP